MDVSFDTLFAIFSFLDNVSLINCTEVCQKFKHVIQKLMPEQLKVYKYLYYERRFASCSVQYDRSGNNVILTFPEIQNLDAKCLSDKIGISLGQTLPLRFRPHFTVTFHVYSKKFIAPGTPDYFSSIFLSINPDGNIRIFSNDDEQAPKCKTYNIDWITIAYKAHTCKCEYGCSSEKCVHTYELGRTMYMGHEYIPKPKSMIE